jgi:hypothetical protein
MRGVAWRQPSSSGAEGAPYRHLAVRIIDQAFRDLASPAGSPEGPESAREFLAGTSMLYHWCEVADLNPACLVARARKLMASSDRCSAPAVIVGDNDLRQHVTHK